MDEELRAYLDSMKTDLMSHQDSGLKAVEKRLGAMETRLGAMETRLEAMETRLEAVETRMMTRINDNQEKMLERFRFVDGAIVTLSQGVAVLTEVAKGTNNTLSIMTNMLTMITNSHNDLGRRMTDLEKKP